MGTTGAQRGHRYKGLKILMPLVGSRGSLHLGNRKHDPTGVGFQEVGRSAARKGQ